MFIEFYSRSFFDRTQPSEKNFNGGFSFREKLIPKCGKGKTVFVDLAVSQQKFPSLTIPLFIQLLIKNYLWSSG